MTTSHSSGRAPGRRLARFVWHHKLVSLSALVLVVAVGSALLVTWIAPFDPYAQDVAMRNRPPLTPNPDGGIHLLGTDPLGRDELSRVMLGGQISLTVAAASVVVSGLFGTTVGMIAGYYRNWFDDVVGRLVDLQMSVPSLLIALLVLYVLGPSFVNVVLVLAVTRWMVYARVSRGLVLALREELFVEAARSLGAPGRRIIVRHLLPNILGPILVLATLELAVMMLTEASLSFLGLGIQPPESSWGLMLAEGREYLTSAWWLVAVPGLAILLTTLSVNIIATWLRSRSSQAQFSKVTIGEGI
ncbi:ABC transporter permease [uncultured Serinicoccus sp.]|uniref:ABC transporter permease n=1 Tax=uncultured Serinicoccus sp. TaxID=735514 RepID=UPI0026098DC5|nr:ABC transporter permease [uncultured Serinicoccus sp.]